MQASKKFKLTKEMKLWLVTAPVYAGLWWGATQLLSLFSRRVLAEPFQFMVLFTGLVFLVCLVLGSGALVSYTLLSVWDRLGCGKHAKRLVGWVMTDDK